LLLENYTEVSGLSKRWAFGRLLTLVGTGFMTFAPEWLTMNQNLDGSNFMFLWVYLVFFNMLWVFLPLFALYVSFVDMKNAFMIRNGVVAARIEMNRRAALEKKE
jgi:hypothetical protein